MITEDDFPTLGSFDSERKEAGAVVLIEDALGRLLLQFRDNFDHVLWGGRWGLVGGGVEPGEDLVTACLREIREEISLTLKAEMLSPFAKLNGVGAIRSKVFVFRTRLDISPVDIVMREGAGFAFFTHEQVRKVDVLDTLRPAVWAYLDQPIRGELYRLP
jgi:8-oxo-dGTP diphosphatase